MAIETLRPTTSSGAWDTQANAYDDSLATASSEVSGGSGSSTWSGFPDATETYTELHLYVSWGISGNDGDTFLLEYSLNGGSSWTPIRSGACTTTAQNTTDITLSTSQTISDIQVRGTTSQNPPKTSGVTCSVYEIWTEGTYSGAQNVTVTPSVITIAGSVNTAIAYENMNLTTTDTNPFGDSSQIFGYNLDGDSTDMNGTYDGTDSSVTYTTGGGGKFDECFTRTTTGLITISPSVSLGDVLAVSLWVKTPDVTTSNYQKAVVFGGTVNRFAHSIGIGSTGFVGNYSSTTTGGLANYITHNTQSSPNEWIHIVANLSTTTTDYTGLNLFINGVETSSTPATAGTADTWNGDITIGGDSLGIDDFNGQIDEVRFFDKALTADEALNLYLMTEGTGSTNVTVVDTGIAGTFTANEETVVTEVNVTVVDTGNLGTFTGNAATIDAVQNVAVVDTGNSATFTVNEATAIAITYIETDDTDPFGDSSERDALNFDNSGDRGNDLEGTYDLTFSDVTHPTGKFGDGVATDGASPSAFYNTSLKWWDSTTPQATISLWIKEGVPGGWLIGSSEATYAGNEHRCNIELVKNTSGNLSVGSFNGGTANASVAPADADILANQYNHVVIAGDASTGQAWFYLNGVYQGTDTNATDFSTTGTGYQIFGRFLTADESDSWYYASEVDQIRIFNKILDIGEVKSLNQEVQATGDALVIDGGNTATFTGNAATISAAQSITVEDTGVTGTFTANEETVVTEVNVTVVDTGITGTFTGNAATIDTVQNVTIEDTGVTGTFTANEETVIAEKNITVVDTGNTGTFTGNAVSVITADEVLIEDTGTTLVGICNNHTVWGETVNIHVDDTDPFGDGSLLHGYQYENDLTDYVGSADGTGSNLQFNLAEKFGDYSIRWNLGDAFSVWGAISTPGNDWGDIRSISFWYDPIYMGSFYTILGLGGDSSNGIQIYYNNSGNLFCYFHNTVNGTYRYSRSYTADISTSGGWHHIVLNLPATAGGTPSIHVNKSENKFTYDGAPTATTPDTLNGNLYVGRTKTGTNWAEGYIDQVMVFNKELSADEIATLYSMTESINATHYDNSIEANLIPNTPTVTGVVVAEDTSGNTATFTANEVVVTTTKQVTIVETGVIGTLTANEVTVLSYADVTTESDIVTAVFTGNEATIIAEIGYTVISDISVITSTVLVPIINPTPTVDEEPNLVVTEEENAPVITVERDEPVIEEELKGLTITAEIVSLLIEEEKVS